MTDTAIELASAQLDASEVAANRKFQEEFLASRKRPSAPVYPASTDGSAKLAMVGGDPAGEARHDREWSSLLALLDRGRDLGQQLTDIFKDHQKSTPQTYDRSKPGDVLAVMQTLAARYGATLQAMQEWREALWAHRRFYRDELAISVQNAIARANTSLNVPLATITKTVEADLATRAAIREHLETTDRRALYRGLEALLGEMRKRDEFFTSFPNFPQTFVGTLPALIETFTAIERERDKTIPASSPCHWRRLAPDFWIVPVEFKPTIQGPVLETLRV